MYTRRFRKRKNKGKIITIFIIVMLFVMTAGYAAFSTNLNITAKGNILEKDRVIQSWTNSSNEDFHTTYYKKNIISTTFLDTSEVPSNATESWNVSEDKERGGVMAWVIPTASDSTKYDLYIGANKGVIANTDSSYLFYGFGEIQSIEFNNNFNTSNTINMMFMFYHCEKLVNLDLQCFDTSKVTDMRCMFDGCYNLEALNVSNFNTENVTNMAQMFYGCYKLITLNLENFNTKNVTSMNYIFFACYALENLNLCSFNTSNLTDASSMFRSTTKLQNIYVGPNWTMDNANTTDMFLGSSVSNVTTGEC